MLSWLRRANWSSKTCTASGPHAHDFSKCAAPGTARKEWPYESQRKLATRFSPPPTEQTNISVQKALRVTCDRDTHPCAGTSAKATKAAHYGLNLLISVACDREKPLWYARVAAGERGNMRDVS